jgi:dTDP-4-dehydrorhamnose 3,5-epimerase
MQVHGTALEGVLILEPEVHQDNRGYVMEYWSQRAFNAATGLEWDFVQDNHSGSKSGVLRGLHYQVFPHVQGKLVSVPAGSIFDVAVDLRRSSTTFGGWFGIELNEENRKQLWIPPGLAHGFLVLSHWAEVLYKMTGYHSQASERVLCWDDVEIGIQWPLKTVPVVSQRDAAGLSLRHAEVFA